MRKFACLAALALALAGCGEKEDALEPSGSKGLQLMLDYFPNADHAGIYAAQAAGHFKQAGLDVTIRQPPDPAAPIKQVAAGRVDLAISYEPEVLRARDLGLNVVSVAAIVQKPLTSIISLPEGKVRTPADLRGKTVGTAGIDYQSAYLSTILTDARVPEASVKSATSALPSPPRSSRARSTPRSEPSGTTRGPSCACAASARASSAWRTPACPPTTSSSWWPTRTRWSVTQPRSGPSSAPSRAAPAS